MQRYLWSITVAAGVVAAEAAPAQAQEVHEIRMVSSGKGEFRFQPASLTVRRGDAFATRSTKTTPSVRFEYAGAEDLVLDCTDFDDDGGGTLRSRVAIPVVEGRLVRDDVVGTSTGTPGQRLPLTHAPLVLRSLTPSSSTGS